MLRNICSQAFLAIALTQAVVRASPINDVSEVLVARDNKNNLKCGNAPNVVAGSDIVNATDVVLQPSLPDTGLAEKWHKYLYCTPGTKTYTYFNLAEANYPDDPKKSYVYTPGYSSIYHAFEQAAAAIHSRTEPDGPIDGGAWEISPPNTNFKIGVKNSVGKLTYGILGAALAGMQQVALNWDSGNNPMAFQINDGEWGEVAIGYAGYLNPAGWCVITFDQGLWTSCDVALNGLWPGL